LTRRGRDRGSRCWRIGGRFRWRPGETLRLVIQGQDIYRYPRPLIQARHDDLVNRGRHVIYSGGEYDSHLLVPVLVPTPAA
jgi:hypothetical protein